MFNRGSEVRLIDDVLCCPNCGGKNDNHTPYSDDKKGPEDGDISICAYCNQVAMFEGDKLVKVKPSFLAGLPEKNRVEIANAHSLILGFKKKVT